MAANKNDDLRGISSSLIRMRGVGVRRNGRWLVRGLDLEIKRGEILTIIGPNGSGKSTTVKLATNIIKPDEGLIERAGHLRIGYVPQKLHIERTLPLTVHRLMTLADTVDETAISAALEMVGAGHLAKMQIATLSGGEFQRVLIARALVKNPDLLVLDEPVQGVDFAGEAALYELISRLREKNGCAILLVSHDLHYVMAATDRVICLNGHICCSGTPQEVSANQSYLQLFGPRAAMPLAFYRHHHDHQHLPDGRVLHKDGSISQNCKNQDRAADA